MRKWDIRILQLVLDQRNINALCLKSWMDPEAIRSFDAVLFSFVNQQIIIHSWKAFRGGGFSKFSQMVWNFRFHVQQHSQLRQNVSLCHLFYSCIIINFIPDKWLKDAIVSFGILSKIKEFLLFCPLSGLNIEPQCPLSLICINHNWCCFRDMFVNVIDLSYLFSEWLLSFKWLKF